MFEHKKKQFFLVGDLLENINLIEEVCWVSEIQIENFFKKFKNSIAKRNSLDL